MVCRANGDAIELFICTKSYIQAITTATLTARVANEDIHEDTLKIDVVARLSSPSQITANANAAAPHCIRCNIYMPKKDGSRFGEFSFAILNDICLGAAVRGMKILH